MTHTIEYPADMEAALRHRADVAGEDLAQLIQRMVADQLAAEALVPRRAPGEFAAKMLAWSRLHPVRERVIDDSRESFYEDRGA